MSVVRIDRDDVSLAPRYQFEALEGRATSDALNGRLDAEDAGRGSDPFALGLLVLANGAPLYLLAALGPRQLDIGTVRARQIVRRRRVIVVQEHCHIGVLDYIL